jgi:hypothetical protein
VDGGVHEAAAELEEVEMGSKDGRSGPSMWRCLAADEEPAVEARTGGRGGRRQAARSWSCAALYQSSGMGRDDRRGAGVGCLWWLSDDEHNGVWSGTGAVKL